MAEAGVGENEPLINSLVGSLGASGYLDISLRVSNQHIETPEDGRVPMFGLIGPNLKLKRVLKLYYFTLIYVLYRFYYSNEGKLATSMLSLAFFPNSSSNDSSNSGDPFSFDHPYFNFLFQMFQFIIPGFLSIIFAFVSDYGKYQRAYLLNYSLGISSIAAFVIMICGYILSNDRSVSTPLPLVLDNVGLPLHKILSVLGIIFFQIGLSMFLPISLAYGLDLLEGTKWKVFYFFFPMMYVANNIGSGFGYLRYLDAAPSHLNINSLICFVVVTIAWILFIIGRGCRILPDQTTVEDNFTIREGIEIFCYALKERITKSKSPRGHWFIQLASAEHFGKYSHEKVQKVSVFFRINFSLFLLLLIFAAYQVLETVFPHQGYTLTFPSPVNQSDMYCKSQTKPYLDSLAFINNFGIIICTPFLEYFFWNVFFYPKDYTEPKFFKYIGHGSLKKGLENTIKLIRGYFNPFDPILKKIFWGLFFGLASIICALLVEVIRIVTIPVNQQVIDCSPSFHHKYRISGISIFSQVPQYMFSSLLEVLTLIGIQQFIYFQWFNTFKSSYKSFMLGLYYFYFCFGSMLANVTYSLIDSSCQEKSRCELCFIYNDACSDNDFKLTTVIWAVLIMVYLVIIVFFGMFSHYRHFQNKRMHLRGDDFHNQFIDCSQTEG